MNRVTGRIALALVVIASLCVADAYACRIIDPRPWPHPIIIHPPQPPPQPRPITTKYHSAEIVVKDQVAEVKVNAPAGSFYALEPAEWIGLGETGAVRAGLAPYTNAEDVDRLLVGVAAIAGE